MKVIFKKLFKKERKEEPDKIKNPKLLSQVLEYVYLDITRLNLYFEQLIPNKKTQELLSMKTTVGVTKLETEVSVQDYVIEFNLSEKIISIINAYKSEYPSYNQNSIFDWQKIMHNQLNNPSLKFLYFENIKAYKVTIPIKEKKLTSDKKYITIWISFGPNFNLYAIEDKSKILSDEIDCYSGYSIIEFFNWSEKAKIEFPEPKILRYLSSLKKAKVELEKIGGKISDERNLNLLGLNRLIYADTINRNIKTGIICYPLIITS